MKGGLARLIAASVSAGTLLASLSGSGAQSEPQLAPRKLEVPDTSAGPAKAAPKFDATPAPQGSKAVVPRTDKPVVPRVEKPVTSRVEKKPAPAIGDDCPPSTKYEGAGADGSTRYCLSVEQATLKRCETSYYNYVQRGIDTTISFDFRLDTSWDFHDMW